MFISFLLLIFSLLIIYAGVEYFKDNPLNNRINFPFEVFLHKATSILRGVLLVLAGVFGSIYFLREIILEIANWLNSNF